MDGVTQKATEVTIAGLPSPFDNVRWNRHRRPNHLHPQRCVIRLANARRHAVNVEGQRMRLSPNAKFAELPHAKL
jgi:hypothetical protein